MSRPVVVRKNGLPSGVATPGAPLSPRERLALSIVARGLSNHGIANEMGIQTSSVKKIIHRIIEKTGATNRVEMTLWWQKNKNKKGDNFAS